MTPRPPLHIVTPDEPAPANAETVGQRVRRLQREATLGAHDHSRAFIGAIADLEALAVELAEAGSPYPVGVTNEARVLARECAERVERLSAIMARAKA